MLGIMLTVNLSCFVRLCCSSLGLSPDTALPRMLRGRSRVLQSVGADAESCGAAQPSEVVPPALCSATCSVQCHVPVPSLQPAPRLSRFAHEPSDVVSKPPARPLFHPQGLLAISEQPRAHRGRFLTAPPPCCSTGYPSAAPGTIHTESVHLCASARQRPAAQRARSKAPFCTAHASLCCRWHPAAGGHAPWCGLGRRHCQSTRTSAQLRFTLTTPATLTPQPVTDARPQRTEPQLNHRRRAPA